MLTEHEALARILAGIRPLPSQSVPLAQALGSFASFVIRAGVPLPGFDNSAMDGYAVRSEDTRTQSPLQVTNAIPAGGAADCHVEPGCAVRIFTGAPMPEGADAVIMQEDVSTLADGQQIICNDLVQPGENVRRQGCDLCVGQSLVTAGDRLTPARLAVLASQGLAITEIAEYPHIAIVTTGDELIDPGTPLQAGRIYNSNATLLQCLMEELSPRAALTFAHLPDDLEVTTSALRDLIARHDAVMMAGGMSVGEHDFIKPALAALGVEAEFWRVKVKPGKPFLFAKGGEARRPCHLFGLPGNPVSVFVTFQLFVRPALLKILGAGENELSLPQIAATMASPLRNSGDRPHYVRGRHHCGKFLPSGVQQSHALFGLSQGNALLRMDPGQQLEEGSEVMLLCCDR